MYKESIPPYNPDTFTVRHPETEQRKEMLQYLAGYFDASSSITISDSISLFRGRKVRSFVLRVEMARVQPEAIELTQSTFPAYTGKQRGTTQPERNRWYAKSNKSMTILEELYPWLRIKRRHVDLARKFQDAAYSRTVDESLGYKQELSRLNHTEIDSVHTPFEPAYIAGFFDAHGAINVYQRPDHKTLEVDMNTYHRLFIAALARQYGQEPKGLYNFWVTANNARIFLESISPFLRIQKRSAELAIEFQVNRTPPVLQKDTQRRKVREEEIIAQLEEEFKRIHKKRRKK